MAACDVWDTHDAVRRAVRAIRHDVRLLEQKPGVNRRMADKPTEYREWLVEITVVMWPCNASRVTRASFRRWGIYESGVLTSATQREDEL
jgi:hypothetical protein